MRPSWLIALFLAFGGRTTAPTVALVADEAVESHRQTADTYVERSSARVVRVGPEQPWPDNARPDVVVSVGDVADAAAARRWPDTPRASISMVGAPPEVISSAGAERVLPRLWISAHTRPTCTAEQLRKVARSTAWIVVADPTDTDAKELAEALHAELVRGTPAQIARALRDRAKPGSHIWIRGAQPMAVPEWLSFLGRMTRLGGPQIGFDLPGGKRWGLHRWVRPDDAAVVDAADQWVARVTRTHEKQTPTLTLQSAPCQRTSSDPHRD